MGTVTLMEEAKKFGGKYVRSLKRGWASLDEMVVFLHFEEVELKLEEMGLKFIIVG